MRSSTIRDITFLDFVIRSNPDYAPEKDMNYFVTRLEQLYRANKTDYWDRNRQKKVFVRDISIDRPNNRATILLNYTDGNAAGVSYNHLDSNAHRDEPPRTREGRAESVHLMVGLTSSLQGEQRFLGLLEDAAKLNRAKVEAYFNFIFREIRKLYKDSDFTAPDPDGSCNVDGTPKTYTFGNKFEVQGHLSDSFIDMLQTGKLTGIALETNRRDQFSFGDGTYVTAKKKELQLAPTSGKWADNAMDRFREALALGCQNDYDNARITFQARDGKSHTARVNTQTSTIVGDNFIKRNRLTGFTVLLSDADTAINAEIRTKMEGFF